MTTSRTLQIVGCSLLFSLVVACLASSAAAQVNRSWGAADGIYQTGSNWLGGVAPADGDNVVFGRSDEYEVNWIGSATSRNFHVFDGRRTFVSTSGAQHTVTGDFLMQCAEMTIGAAGRPIDFVVDSASGVVLSEDNRLTIAHGSTLRANEIRQSTESGFTLLRIESGGRLLDSNVSVGELRPSVGEFVILGAGSRWEASGHFFSAGTEGSGSLTIRDGGFAEVLSATLGSDSGIGRITVQGSSSELIAGDTIIAGGQGFGEIIVDGGQLTTTDLTIADFGTGGLGVYDGGSVCATNLEIGAGFGALGFAEVLGSGSIIQVDSALVLGTGSVSPAFQANLDIISGGSVRAASTTINEDAGVTVSGGRFSFGNMTLEDFARVTGTIGTLAGSLLHSDNTNIADFTRLTGTEFNVDFVTLQNSGVIHGSGSVAVGLRNEIGGEIQAFAGEQMRFGGLSENNGEINLFAGLIRFDDTLTNSQTGFIGGRGVIVSNQGIDNAGTMAFTGATDILGDVIMNVDSRMVTSGFATTTLFDDVTFLGSGSEIGEIRTSDGAATVLLGAVIGEANFSGSGAVFLEGDLRPGNSAGTALFEGDLSLGSLADTFIELGGEGLGEFDQLRIAGDLGIDGLLIVSLIDEFSLGFGQEFLIADVEGTMTGMFRGLNEGSLVGNFGGQDLFITYNGLGGNRGVGLFTSVPEPSSGVLLGLLAINATLYRRRRLSAN